MMKTLSEIQTPVARGFSALHPVFKNRGLISFSFLKKYHLILHKIEANCGRWARFLPSAVYVNTMWHGH
jgi:hypothetical protein